MLEPFERSKEDRWPGSELDEESTQLRGVARIYQTSQRLDYEDRSNCWSRSVVVQIARRESLSHGQIESVAVECLAEIFGCASGLALVVLHVKAS